MSNPKATIVNQHSECDSVPPEPCDATVWSRCSDSAPTRHGSDPSSPRPLYVRALDAFEAFYRQLGVVSERMAELHIAFDGKPIPLVVLAVADLHSAVGVLYARLELLEVVTNDDAGRDLWTHPMMELMRSRLRALLQDGAVYVSRHPDDRRVLQQLRNLEVTLDTEEQLVREMTANTSTLDERAVDRTTGGPDSALQVVIVKSAGGRSDGRLPSRCRTRESWRQRHRRSPVLWDRSNRSPK